MNETDIALMIRLRRSDEEALRQLIEMHREWLYRTAVGLLHDEEAAADAVQETFIRTWLHRHRYSPLYAPATWLRTICVRLCMDELRRRERHRKALTSAEEAVMPSPYLADDVESLLRHVVEGLPRKQRAVFQLCEIERLTTDEVCRLLRMKPTQLKANLWNARTHVKNKLKEYGIL